MYDVHSVLISTIQVNTNKKKKSDIYTEICSKICSQKDIDKISEDSIISSEHSQDIISTKKSETKKKSKPAKKKIKTITDTILASKMNSDIITKSIIQTKNFNPTILVNKIDKLIRNKSSNKEELYYSLNKLIKKQSTKSKDLSSSKIKSSIQNKTEIVTDEKIKTTIIEVKKNSSLSLKSSLTKSIKDYKIGKLIGKGSFNNIFELQAQSNNIIRILKKNGIDGLKNEQEGIKIQYTLKHNNICSIIDYGYISNTSNLYSIIPKYGVSLKYILENKPVWNNMNTILTFIREFLEVLSFIHNHNFAHLDLKPSNILLKNVFSSKKIYKKLDFVLIDFGASKRLKNDKSIHLDGQMASPAFSPPEISDVYFGKKNDIWAFGIIVYLVLIKILF